MMNEEDPEQPLLLDEMHQNQSEEASKESGSEGPPQPLPDHHRVGGGGGSSGGGGGHKPEVSITGIHVSPSSSPVPGVVPGGSSNTGLRSRNPQINSGWL